MAKQQVTRKRTQLRKKKSDSIDPRILALGAGAGALVGGGIARATTGRAARKQVADRVAKLSRANAAKAVLEGFDSSENTRRSARAVNDVEYAKMPRVDKGKLATYKTLRGDSGWNSAKELLEKSEASRKMAGLSKRDLAKYHAKGNARMTSDYSTTKGLMENAAYMTAGRIRRGRTVKGAAAGASAATVAMIVSAVLKELNKK